MLFVVVVVVVVKSADGATAECGVAAVLGRRVPAGGALGLALGGRPHLRLSIFLALTLTKAMVATGRRLRGRRLGGRTTARASRL